jgi:hypothetical protein
MKICESKEKCNKERCLHKKPHHEFDAEDNRCTAKCNVDGGVEGSVCVDLQQFLLGTTQDTN